jgi:hypothetical protein
MEDQLADKIEKALNEGRLLMLGVQILLGAQYAAVFQDKFDDLSPIAKALVVGGLAPLLLAVALLLLPPAYHRIVQDGYDSKRFHHLITRLLAVALFPLALDFAIYLYVAADKLFGPLAGLVAGVLCAGIALYLWYGISLAARTSRSGREASPPAAQEKPPPAPKKAPPSEESPAKPPPKGTRPTELSKRVEHVLTELRVVLPGVQALLGFQFSTMLTAAFDKLPASSKYLHLASLALLTLTILFLSAPAAYHRIAADGQDTERVDRFSGRMLLAGMAVLAPALAADLIIVVRKVTDSLPFAIACAVLLLILLYGLWFGYTRLQREQNT